MRLMVLTAVLGAAYYAYLETSLLAPLGRVMARALLHGFG